MPTESNFMARAIDKTTSNQKPSNSFFPNVVPTIPEKSMHALRSSESRESWILDSGASTHFTHNLQNMFNYQSCDVRVEFGKGSAKALAFGSVRLEVVGDKNRTVTFSEVYYVPEMRANLLSTEKLRSKGLF